MSRAAQLGSVALLVGGLAAGCWAMRAQVGPADGELATASSFGGIRQAEVDALLETPVPMSFREPTPLSRVADHLARSLRLRVVLDPAALARLDLLPEDPVQLDLDGTLRLRTALPLLLDQLGLTYRFDLADRLLILTDASGAGDPRRQALDELRDLHRDVHDLQDLVEDLYDALVPAEAPMPRTSPALGDEPPPPDTDDADPRPGRRSRAG